MNNQIRCVAGLALMCLVMRTTVGAQTHDHAAMAAVDGEFNPYVVSDNHGGFYVAYVERKAGVSNVMFQHSTTANGFAAAERVNNRPGDGAVRNENPPKIAIGPKCTAAPACIVMPGSAIDSTLEGSKTQKP